MKKILITIFLSLIISFEIYPFEVGLNPRFSIAYDRALINNAVFSPDSKIVATTEAKKVQLWDAKTGKLLSTVHTYTNKPMFLNFSASGRLLITGAYGGKEGSPVMVWNVSEKKQVGNLATMSLVASVAISPDDTMAAVAGIVQGDNTDASITLWSMKTGKIIATLKKKNVDLYHPQSLLFSKDSKTLLNAVSNKEHGIEIWDLKTMKLKQFIPAESDVTEISLSPDENTLAAGLLIAETKTQNAGGFLRIFSYPAVNKLYDLKGAKGHITSLSFHPDGQFLASGAYGSRPNYTIWNLKTKSAHFQNMNGKRQALKAIFSPDGKSLAVVLNTSGNLGNPDTLQIMDVGSKEELQKTGSLNDINTFQVGEKVNVIIDGTVYSGEINEKKNGHYLLKMDNRKPEYWKWVEPGSIRPR